MALNYQTLKSIAKENGVRVKDLIALAPQNDPFYTGTETEEAMARWFAELWERFGYARGVHLRRVHYQLVSQEHPEKHNGEPYENTVNDWQHLCNAGKYARYLGYVAVDAFVDRRNPEPHIFVEYEYRTSPRWEVNLPHWNIPELPTDIDLPLPEPDVYGYSYSLADQPFHLEVWCEKSTMNDALEPVCREHGVNLVTGLGEMSITAVHELIKRVRQARKPTRIFYISDYDPAGYGMPISVARKVEYMVQDQHGFDIRLHPVVLTRRQVREYRLPRTPIKDSERRKDSFENIHGEGAVELDALEALHPGELARLIEQEIQPYRDAEIEEDLNQADMDAEKYVREQYREAMQPYLDELSGVREGIRTVLDKYSSFNEEMRPYRERLDEIEDRMERAQEELEIDMPPRPTSEPTDNEPGSWLFDSRREYVTQLQVYQQQRHAEELST